MITTLNMDCMEYMKTIPDKYFELSISDPPYGIGIDGQKLNNTNKNPKHNRKHHPFKGWDIAPDKQFFDELFRISKHQIIWGGNYFTEYLYPTKAWIFWYKGQRDLTMSDGEMAWTSISTVTRQIEINRGALALDGSIHPTQKPVALYKWLLRNYAKPGDKIFDPMAGSFSSAIACHDLSFDYVGIELDTDYYNSAMNRLRLHQQQQTLSL